MTQCDENLLMELACNQTYLMVYSVVYDLGIHISGPYLWIVLEKLYKINIKQKKLTEKADFSKFCRNLQIFQKNFKTK